MTTSHGMTAERMATLIDARGSRLLWKAESEELKSHIDAQATRIAAVERDRAWQQAETLREIGKNVPLKQKISKLQAELAAAQAESARLRTELERCSNSLALLIAEVKDPGTEALAALHTASVALAELEKVTHGK